jgi:hypothetical protein
MLLKSYRLDVLLLLVVFGISSPIHAQPSSYEDNVSSLAEEAFVEGRSALALGDMTTACDLFSKSHQLEPSFGALIGLGACREQQGQLVSAWKAYTEAATVAVKRQHPDRAEGAQSQAERLLPDLYFVHVALGPSLKDVAGLVLTVDGVQEQSTTWPVRVPLDPGVHEVQVTASRDMVWKQSVDVPRYGGWRILTVIPPPPPTPAVSKPSQAGSQKTAVSVHPIGPISMDQTPPLLDLSETQWLGTGLITAGLVSTGLGIYKTIELIDYDRSADRECPSSLSCSDETLRTYNQNMRSASDWATGFGIGALVLLTGGTSLVIWGGDPATGTVVSVGLGSDGALAAMGTF